MVKKKDKGKIIDGLITGEMSRPQIMGHIVRLQVELDREREERNYYMLEREKIFQLWNLLLEQIQLEKEKAALFASHMMDVQKNKDDEDNLYNQKLRFLKQEQARKLGQVRLHHLGMMKHVQDDAWAVQMVMKEALMGKKKEIRKAQLAFFQIIRGLHWKHSKSVSDLRSEFAREIRRLETTFDRRLFENNDKKEEGQDQEVAKLAEIKENQMHKLIDSHRYQTKELQTFFRDMIRHNLTLIYGMKESAKKQKTFELRARKDYQGFKEKYDKYVSLAVKWKDDMVTWEAQHEEDLVDDLMEQLHKTNDELKKLRHTQRMIECSNETIKQQIIIGDKERVALKKEFGRAIVDVQKRTSMNRFVHQIKKNAAIREAELYESLADNLEKDPEDEADYYLELHKTLDGDNEDVQQEIIDFATEHKNTEENYKEAFMKNEINLSDIGFPIKKTGAKTRGTDDDIMATAEQDKMSRRHKSFSSTGSTTKTKSVNRLGHASTANLSVNVASSAGSSVRSAAPSSPARSNK